MQRYGKTILSTSANGEFSYQKLIYFSDIFDLWKVNEVSKFYDFYGEKRDCCICELNYSCLWLFLSVRVNNNIG